MKIAPIAWFREIWPTPQRRLVVLGEYAAIGKHALADICLRGGVWSSLPRVAGDVFGDGVNEGRRQLAVEIVELNKADPQQLYRLIERKPE